MASKSAPGSEHSFYNFNELISQKSRYNYGVQVPQGHEGAQGYPQGPQGHQGLQGALLLQPFEPSERLRGFQGVQGFQGSQGFIGHQPHGGLQRLQEFQVVQRLQGPQGPQGYIENQLHEGLQRLQGYQGVQGYQVPQGPTLLQPLVGLQRLQDFQGTQGFPAPQGPQGFIGNQPHQGLQSPQEFQDVLGFQGSQDLMEPQSFQGLEAPQGPPGSNVPGPRHTGSLFCNSCFATTSFFNSSNTLCQACGSKLPDFMSDEIEKIRGYDSRRGFDIMNHPEFLHWNPTYFSQLPSLDDKFLLNTFGTLCPGQILGPSLSINIPPDSLGTLATAQVKTDPPSTDSPPQPVGSPAMNHPRKRPLSPRSSHNSPGNSPMVQRSVQKRQPSLEIESCNLCGDVFLGADAQNRHQEICERKPSSLAAVIRRKSVESSFVGQPLVQGSGEILPQPPVSVEESTSNSTEKCRLCAKDFHGRNAAQRRIKHEKTVCKMRSYLSAGSSQGLLEDSSAGLSTAQTLENPPPLPPLSGDESGKVARCSLCGRLFAGRSAVGNRTRHEKSCCPVKLGLSASFRQYALDRTSANESSMQVCGESLPQLKEFDGEPGKVDPFCRYCDEKFEGPGAIWRRTKHERTECQRRSSSFSAGVPLETVAGSSTPQLKTSITTNDGSGPDHELFTTLADQLATQVGPVQPTQLDSDVHKQIIPSIPQAETGPFDTQSAFMQTVEDFFFDAAFDPTADYETETPGAITQPGHIQNSCQPASSSPILQTRDTNNLLQQLWDLGNVDDLLSGGLGAEAPLPDGMETHSPTSKSSFPPPQAMSKDVDQMGIVGCSPSGHQNMLQEPQMTQARSSPSNETWMPAQEPHNRTPPLTQQPGSPGLAQRVDFKSSPPEIAYSLHGQLQLPQSAEMQDKQSPATLQTTTQPSKLKSSSPEIAGPCDHQLHQQQMQQMRANSRAEFMSKGVSAYEPPLTQQSRHLLSNIESQSTQPHYTQRSREPMQINHLQETQTQYIPEGWERLQNFVLESAETRSLQPRQQSELQSLGAHMVKTNGAGVVKQGPPDSYGVLTDERSVPPGYTLLTGDMSWEQAYGTQSTPENKEQMGLRGGQKKLGRRKMRLRGGYGEFPSTPAKSTKRKSALRSQLKKSQLRQESLHSPVDAQRFVQMGKNNGELIPRNLPPDGSTGPQITERVQPQRSNINRPAKEVMLTDGKITNSKLPPRPQGLCREATSSVHAHKAQNSPQGTRISKIEKARLEVLPQRAQQWDFSSRLRGGHHPLPEGSEYVQQHPPSPLELGLSSMQADWGNDTAFPQQPVQFQHTGHRYPHSVQSHLAGGSGIRSSVADGALSFPRGQAKDPQYVPQYPAPHLGHGLWSLPAQKENRLPVPPNHPQHHRQEPLNTPTIHQNPNQLPKLYHPASNSYSLPHISGTEFVPIPQTLHPSHLHPQQLHLAQHPPSPTTYTRTLPEALKLSKQSHQQRPQPKPTAPVQQRHSFPVRPSWTSQKLHHPSLQEQQNRWKTEYLRSHRTHTLPLNPSAKQSLIWQPPHTPESVATATLLPKDRQSKNAIQQENRIRREKKWVWRWKKEGWRTVRVDESMSRVGTPLRVVSCASPSDGVASEAEAEDACWGEGDAYRESEREVDEGQDEDGYEEDEREGEMWRERVERWKRGVVRETHNVVAAEKGVEEAAGNGSSKTFFERLAEEGEFEEEGGFFTDALWEGGM